MKNELKLKIKIEEQQMTFWKIVKEEDNYLMFNASITSGKKNPDGTWDNVSTTFTCFIFSSEDGKGRSLIKSLNEKTKIKVSGILSMLPEKRTAVGKNGEYQETIFSNCSISIDTVELLGAAGHNNSSDYAKQSGKSDVVNTEKDYTTYAKIDDDIPF